MSEAKLALDELRKGLRIFRAFEHAEVVITQVQSAEQQVAEAQLALAALRSQIDAGKALVNDSVAAAQATVDAARAQAADIQETADKALADASAEAARVRIEADAYYEKTKAGCDGMINAAQAKVDTLVAERDELEAAANAAEKRAETARAYIAKLKE